MRPIEAGATQGQDGGLTAPAANIFRLYASIAPPEAMPSSIMPRRIAVAPLFEPRQSKVGHMALARARADLGKNPTGWRSLWCARYISMLLPHVARKVANPNMARSYAVLPKVKPEPGVIVVLTRGRSKTAGHMGLLEAFDKRGNPIIISGNHGGKVGRGTYPRGRVIAYVSAA